MIDWDFCIRCPSDGQGHNNFDELKKHDFFAGVDWDNVPPSDLSKLEPKPREPKPSPVRRGASLATIDADEAKKWLAMAKFATLFPVATFCCI